MSDVRGSVHHNTRWAKSRYTVIYYILYCVIWDPVRPLCHMGHFTSNVSYGTLYVHFAIWDTVGPLCHMGHCTSTVSYGTLYIHCVIWDTVRPLCHMGHCTSTVSHGTLYVHCVTWDTVRPLDVHGSVHHNINPIEITNKMRPRGRIYYSDVS